MAKIFRGPESDKNSSPRVILLQDSIPESPASILPDLRFLSAFSTVFGTFGSLIPHFCRSHVKIQYVSKRSANVNEKGHRGMLAIKRRQEISGYKGGFLSGSYCLLGQSKLLDLLQHAIFGARLVLNLL